MEPERRVSWCLPSQFVGILFDTSAYGKVRNCQAVCISHQGSFMRDHNWFFLSYGLAFLLLEAIGSFSRCLYVHICAKLLWCCAGNIVWKASRRFPFLLIITTQC